VEVQAMIRQPLELQTLYAELLEQLEAYEAGRALGDAPGSFVTKSIKGADYYYFQYADAGGAKKQAYLGRRSGDLEDFVRRATASRENRAGDAASIQRLATLLRTGGMMATDTGSARVLRGLADAGVFRLGAVLVGTHAFVAIGNSLGLRWADAMLRTQDLDVASPRRLALSVPEGLADVAQQSADVDVPEALASLEMGFLPVPGLDPRSPSTSFKVRGQGLRVDLLTPSARVQDRPVSIRQLGAAAQPLRFLDFVMEGTFKAAVFDGGGVLVNVPDPARYAVHKLIVAGERGVASAAKRTKDLWQVQQLLDVLMEDRSGDLVMVLDALRERGPGWAKRVRAQAAALPTHQHDAIVTALRKGPAA
jgi:hypothetical protein